VRRERVIQCCLVERASAERGRKQALDDVAQKVFDLYATNAPNGGGECEVTTQDDAMSRLMNFGEARCAFARPSQRREMDNVFIPRDKGVSLARMRVLQFR
jgi:hypothetical protein